MRRYETIVIIDPDLSEDDRKAMLERIGSLISDQEGFLVLEDDWGSRKLAYEIKKKVRGHYVRLDFCGTGDLVREMERLFRIDDRILKYMTVQLEDHVDLEHLKSEIAAAEETDSEEEAEDRDADSGEKEEAEAEPAETETTATESTEKE